jgi:hypothetical protein
VVKQIWTGLIAVGTIFAGAQLSAQSAKPVTLNIALGAAIPVGDLSDGFNTGYNGTVGLGLTSIGTPLGIRFEGMYNKFGGRDDLGVNQPDARIIGGTANLEYSLPGMGIRPYLIGGAGYYGLKLDAPNAESNNKFGVNGGIGAVFPLSGFNTYVEARLHHVFTDNNSTQFIPVVFGLQF